MYDSIIIGSGPAGLTAAIYNARADMKVLCIEGATPGGQLMLTTEVENYPGFPEGITGPDMMQLFRKQAERFGTEYVTKNVTAVDFSGDIKKVMVGDDIYETKTVTIATGSNAKWLGVPGEKEFQSKGVSACATCDGFFFRGKEVAIIGGGDTAMEEALFLTKFATKVTVLVRKEELKASKIMQDRAIEHEKIEFLWNTEVKEYMGTEKLEKLKLWNNKTNEESELEVQGTFVAIGHTPATEIFKGKLEMDDVGYVLRKENSMTSITGVFTAGDVHDHRYMQAVTAAGMGCQAAIDAERWLEENHGKFE
ncbi:MAG: thioredoxin-disulfide reductase [Candidatus Gracilibacteria bacterium]|nr:thioredoxin-disulfide reductase [Candidatus Gracilibacteria bacterium]